MTTIMFRPSSSSMPLISSSSPTLLMNSCSPTPLPRNYHIQNQNSKLIYPFIFFFIINSKSINLQPKTIINIKNPKFPQNFMVVHAEIYDFFSCNHSFRCSELWEKVWVIDKMNKFIIFLNNNNNTVKLHHHQQSQ